jgi:2OG-Fe(II) oxygenase superfamily
MSSKYINGQYLSLIDTAEKNADSYIHADPFPNIQFTNFFNEKFLNEVLSEFPDLSKQAATKFDNVNEKKLAGRGEQPFGEKTKDFFHYLNSEPFLVFLQKLTGIKELLLPDSYFEGGGQHEIKPGGLLKIHADFNKSRAKLDRRLNLLVFLNKDWQESYGGHFELWNKDMTKCVKKVLPAFNTMVIFSTTDFSYHGHPNPLTCPPDRSRKSLALYYYSNGRPAEEFNPELGEHSTLFKERAGIKDDVSLKDPLLNRLIRNITPPIILKGVKRIFK